MKKTFHILTAALLLTAGALLTTGCGNDDTAIDTNQPAQGRTVMFTATLAPMGDNGSQTRAITPGTDPDDGKEILNVAWKKNEKIAIYYQKTDGSYAKEIATVGTPNSDGSAPITATLTDAKGGEAKFVYPASMMNKNGEIIWSNLRLKQKGYLTTPETGSGSSQGQSEVNLSTNTISSDFDIATGTGTIAVNGTDASVSGKVKMANECCICKFNISIPVSEQVSTVTHYDITVDFAGGDTYKLSEIPKDRLNELYVAMRPVSKVLTTITAKGYIPSGGGISSTTPTILSTHSKVINSVDLVAGRFYRNVPVTLQNGIFIYLNGNVQFFNTGELLLVDGAVVAGAGGANTILKIKEGATVTLNGLTNTDITANANIPGIECLGDATIILSGENSVRGREDAPGIFIPEDKTLTIMGSGKLDATGGNTSKTDAGSGNIGGAGIGGTKDTSCGNIVIAGGTVTATGTGRCAGIGSGWANGANITCGNITISGGTVTATGGNLAAGIGSGKAGDYTNECGAITISGGTVEATGGNYAAGIGSGDTGSNTNKCGAITISGGTVEATGGERGAGIGTGQAGDYTNECGAITISGGSVTATGGDRAAGIGSGYADQARNTCGDITISGSAEVTAVGKTFAAGIGTGSGTGADKNGICGAISITGGTVEATGGDRAAGIGSGYLGKFASIHIGSGITSVTATRSNDYDNVPIGKGFDDQGSGRITFGTQDMYNYVEDRNPKWGWEHFPQNGQTYGGIKVAVTNTPFNDATWKLTPAP